MSADTGASLGVILTALVVVVLGVAGSVWINSDLQEAPPAPYTAPDTSCHDEFVAIIDAAVANGLFRYSDVSPTEEATFCAGR